MESPGSGGRRIGRGAAGALLIGVMVAGLMAINMSDRYVPAVSDWYTRMVIRYLPDQALRLTPMSDDERAFYVCARSVARRMGGETSVETFASSEIAVTRNLEGGRVLIESYVEESQGPGRTQRHVFTCILRSEGAEWVLEDLQMREATETPTTDLASKEP